MANESRLDTAELELRRQRLDREFKNSRSSATKALADIEKSRQVLADAVRALEGLQRICRNMKASEGVVSLKEFAEVKRLIADNVQLRQKFTLEIENLKKRGKSAADMSVQMERNLATVMKQLNAYGRVLAFPTKEGGPNGKAHQQE